MKIDVTSIWASRPDGPSTWLPAIDHENLPSGSFVAVALVSTVEVEELETALRGILDVRSNEVDTEDIAWTNDNVHVDGSNINHWAKYSTRSINSPRGPFQVHFYMNRVTGKVNYDVDYKAKFNAGVN